MTVHRPTRAPWIVSPPRFVIAPFLQINFVVQSYLHLFVQQCLRRCSTQHGRQQLRCLTGLGTIAAFSTFASLCGLLSEPAEAFLLGTALPGAGFLHWAAGEQAILAIGCLAAGLCTFGVALLVWFATGNVLVPLITWLMLAWAAGSPDLLGIDGRQVAPGWQLGFAPGVYAMLALAWLKPGKSADWNSASSGNIPPPASPRELRPELSLEEMQRLRLLFDRALQPAERFDGFERRDQFQTAALRYQVNFMAYALALARQRFAPAADAGFREAQERLLFKIGDNRLWRYWLLENAWGRLRASADPVPHDNIMYSGFTALQMAVSGQHGDLVLHQRGHEWRRYSLGAIAALLERQYGESPYGLLACEPNWIYPLCNLISAAGIRAADARLGSDRWPRLEESFLESLCREGTRPDGSFIAFRSALTGIAPPAPGGITMQTFPCLFLNCIAPEAAHEHWQRVRQRLASGSWHSLFWRVDVGNYGLSRASGYAATAAAAVELGDRGVAEECLQRLAEECPSRCEQGVIHRERASLWALALELAARCSRQDGLRDLAANAGECKGPRLVKANYPEVLVARAHAEDRMLELVLHPGSQRKNPLIELGGLLPERHYYTGNNDPPFLKADRNGRALMRVTLNGRTSFTIRPVV